MVVAGDREGIHGEDREGHQDGWVEPYERRERGPWEVPYQGNHTEGFGLDMAEGFDLDMTEGFDLDMTREILARPGECYNLEVDQQVGGKRPQIH